MTLCSYKEAVKNTSLKGKLSKILRRWGGFKIDNSFKGKLSKYYESVGGPKCGNKNECNSKTITQKPIYYTI